MLQNPLYTGLFFLICLLSCSSAFARQYSVDSIDSTLTENAAVVIREYHTEIEVTGRNRSEYRQKMVVTIMEPRGLAMADIRVVHDSFRKINSISGKIFDRDGEFVRDLQKSEFEDKSLITGFSVYSDNRLIETDLYSNRYPFTVEYEYTLDWSIVYLNQLWVPVDNTNISAENTSLKIIVPQDLEFRYSSKNHEGLEPIQEITEKGQKKYTWKIENIKAVVSEPYMPRWYFIFPYVLISPAEFNYGGYAGNMESWQNFGMWINELNRNRQSLPRRTISQIRALTENLTDTLEKVKAVYEFVQSNTRYVNIMLGIGGFQPESASDVNRTGYGDCKALSNYTMALLNAVGIDSYYTLIRSGREYLPVNPNFPHNYFNHVILCVPLANDTIWLETTSQTFPTGFIGTGNISRYVLVITPEGGKLARTPSFQQHRNIISQKTNANLSETGDVNATMKKQFTGLAYEERLGIELAGEQRQREFFIQKTPLNRLELNEIIYSVHKHTIPAINKSVSFTIMDYLRRAGNRFVFQPLILQETFPSVSPGEKRIHDFETGSSMVYTDTIVWQLSDNYLIQQIPGNISLETGYGTYELKFQFEKDTNTLIVMRNTRLTYGYFPSEQFSEFADFLRFIRQGDRTSILLQKKIQDNKNSINKL
jgi:hypothetical protein